VPPFAARKKTGDRSQDTEYSLLDELPAAENGKADESDPEQQHCRRFRDGHRFACRSGYRKRSQSDQRKRQRIFFHLLIPVALQDVALQDKDTSFLKFSEFPATHYSGHADQPVSKQKNGCQFENGVTVKTQFS
jgi:hypothetical protein